MLGDLPIERWSRWLASGTLRLVGSAPAACEVGGVRVPEGGGRVEVELAFACVEGPRVELARVRCSGALTPLSVVPFDNALRELILGLHDVTVEATGVPAVGVALRLTDELRLALEPDVRVTVHGETAGPADGLRLVRPLVVGFGGAGMRLEHAGYRRASRLAAIRVVRASVAPDGQVSLAGRGRGLLDRAVQRGLKAAAAAVTGQVRAGRRLRSLRPFLQLDAVS